MAISKTIAEARNKHLHEKLNYYLTAAAIAVMAEEDTHDNHTNRQAYAKTILRGQADIYQVALAVVSNLTVSGKIEADEDYDSDIAYVITTIFDAFANAES